MARRIANNVGGVGTRKAEREQGGDKAMPIAINERPETAGASEGEGGWHRESRVECCWIVRSYPSPTCPTGRERNASTPSSAPSCQRDLPARSLGLTSRNIRDSGTATTSIIRKSDNSTIQP